jgi:hypothetical protein
MITSAALSPTGPFRQASDFLILSTVESGKALPNFLTALSPAKTSSIVNFVLELSFIVSKIVFAEQVRSGPIPSPMISVILYLDNKAFIP